MAGSASRRSKRFDPIQHHTTHTLNHRRASLPCTKAWVAAFCLGSGGGSGPDEWRKNQMKGNWDTALVRVSCPCEKLSCTCLSGVWAWRGWA